MEIEAYGRSCAEAIFGSPGCHLFDTSHLDAIQSGTADPARVIVGLPAILGSETTIPATGARTDPTW
jgi:hypothetical protein